MDLYTQMIDLCLFLAGIYMLYSAVTGKGSLYKTDNVKKGKEESYRKFIRWFCVVCGVIAIATVATDALKLEPYATILFGILCALIVAFCAAMFVFNERRAQRRL